MTREEKTARIALWPARFHAYLDMLCFTEADFERWERRMAEIFNDVGNGK